MSVWLLSGSSSEPDLPPTSSLRRESSILDRIMNQIIKISDKRQNRKSLLDGNLYRRGSTGTGSGRVKSGRRSVSETRQIPSLKRETTMPISTELQIERSERSFGKTIIKLYDVSNNSFVSQRL